MNQNPFGGAVWIEPSYPAAAPIFTKKFNIYEETTKAVLNITGLGYFEVKINGLKITEDMFIPPASDYFRRNFTDTFYPVVDTFTHRIYYHTFDVSAFLAKGENVLEIQCGGGFFVQNERIAEGSMSYADRPRCIFNLNVGENNIFSDGSENWVESNIRQSSLFIGEVIDFSFIDDKPKGVNVVKMPDTILSPAEGAHDKIIRKITPEIIKKEEGRLVCDIGENISGLLSLTTNAPKGVTYIIKYSELIDENMEPDFLSTGSDYKGTSGKAQIMQDEFLTNGEKNVFMPKFVWHAFRYFEVWGPDEFIEELNVYVIHADTPLTAEFESDNEALNFLFDAYVRTQLSNYHGSFPSDCPHRERLGYTGDGQVCSQSAMMMLDCQKLYKKWIRDILDGQDKLTGHIQHTAPFQGGGGGPGGWGCAVATVPYAYYKQYGDISILEDALPAIERYIDFMEGSMECGLVVKEIEGGWCLGDWCMKKSARLPESFVNTCYFLHLLDIYEKLMKFAGKSVADKVAELKTTCNSALKKQYEEIKHITAASIYAAWAGIDSVEKCAEIYSNMKSFDTGFLGTDILCDILFKNNFGNVASKLLTSSECGSYLYMKNHGATTIWENWDGHGSQSHPMFGASARQLFAGILGIRQDEESLAYESVTISPYLPENVNKVKGSIMTPKGRICVSLERESDKIKIDIKVPGNINAKFVYKDKTERITSNFTQVLC